MWNLTGMYVRGLYMGSIPVEGHVESSRIRGSVQHTVRLEKPLQGHNGSMCDRVIMRDSEVQQVWDNPEEFGFENDARYDDQFELDTDYN